MRKYVAGLFLGIFFIVIVGMVKATPNPAAPPTTEPSIDPVSGQPVGQITAPTNLSTAATEATTWVKYIHNPIITPTLDSWNSEKVGLSSVMVDSTGYKMWYSGNNRVIGYATSSDGLNWTKYLTPVLEPDTTGNWDSGYVMVPHVIYHEGIYKMWYRGALKADTSYGASIGYATSPDGIHWTKYPGNPILTTRSLNKKLSSAYVIATGNNYQMWYSDLPSSKINYATSTDGINWLEYGGNPVLRKGLEDSWDNEAVAYPYLVFNGRNYEMWYAGNYSSIGYATSSDGISWSKFPNNPLFEPGAKKSWDSNFTMAFAVVLQNGIYKLWYSGRDANDKTQIGYAFKGAQAVISPTVDSQFTYNDDQGNPTTVEVAAGSVNKVVTLIFNEITYFQAPSGFRSAGHAFTLEAWDGKQLPTFVFQQPVTVTISYSPADINGLNKNKLKLYYRSNNVWLDTACGQYVRNFVKNQVTVPICHLSEMALLEQIPITSGEVKFIYLPLILK